MHVKPLPFLQAAEQNLTLGFTKNEWLTGLIALATVVFASMQLCGTLPSELSGHIFSYIAISLGAAATIHALTQIKQQNKVLLILTALALLTIGILGRTEVLSGTSLAIGMTSISVFLMASLFVAHKLRKQVQITYEKNYKQGFLEVGRSFADHIKQQANTWAKTVSFKVYESLGSKAAATIMTLAAIALLVFGSMKLARVLPVCLDGPMLSYLSIAVGGAAILLTAYRIYQKNSRYDLKDELLAGVALLALGLLALTHQLSAWQLSQALVGTTSALFGLSLLFTGAFEHALKNKLWKIIAQEGRRLGSAEGASHSKAFFERECNKQFDAEYTKWQQAILDKR